MTETYNEIVQIKAEMVEFLADAQKAAEKAEEERKAAEEAQKKAEEAALAAAKSQALIELALMDTTGCNAEQKEAAAAVLAAAREAIQAAETREEVAALLAEAQEAMEEAMNLVCASDLFRDVAENTWYHEGVDYMVRQGYMDGMGGGLFGVNGTMTRGQMVTILYRIAGKPSVEGLENPFRDVAEGRYYTDAVIWAAANGIVEGMEEGVFAPEGAVTRQQVAVILYRHSGAEAGNEDLLSSYPDGKQVAPYARQAMNWAVSQGLIRGVENGGVTTLSPAATATRAQMATIFLRYLEQQAKRLEGQTRPGAGPARRKLILCTAADSLRYHTTTLYEWRNKIEKVIFQADCVVSMRSCHAGRHLCRRNETGVRRRGNPGLLAGTPGNSQRVLL